MIEIIDILREHGIELLFHKPITLYNYIISIYVLVYNMGIILEMLASLKNVVFKTFWFNEIYKVR
jgi:hypothetical protein